LVYQDNEANTANVASNENDVGRPTVIDGLLGMKCIKVSAGRSTNMVLTVNEKNEKTVWSWGRGDDGRLGSGDSA